MQSLIWRFILMIVQMKYRAVYYWTIREVGPLLPSMSIYTEFIFSLLSRFLFSEWELSVRLLLLCVQWSRSGRTGATGQTSEAVYRQHGHPLVRRCSAEAAAAAEAAAGGAAAAACTAEQPGRCRTNRRDPSFRWAGVDNWAMSFL